MPLKINIEKAKEIHKDKIREVRNPLLQQKDVEFMKALEVGDSQKIAEITAEKQSLRDVTLIVNDAVITSTDVMEVTVELKQVWDSNILGENPLTT